MDGDDVFYRENSSAMLRLCLFFTEKIVDDKAFSF